jgi:negative regulator of flagellin synthesis FlgM
MNNSSDSAADGKLHCKSKRQMSEPGNNSADKADAAQTGQAGNLLNLTARAQELRTLHQNMAMSPEFDAARVGELKQAIASGLYAVNAVRIAEKLLAVEAKLP